MSLWPSPWPTEDGGPRRSQAPSEVQGPGSRPAGRVVTAAVGDAFATTMVVLREPGEVFALRHTLGRRPLRDPSTGWVERIDPITLAAVGRSPDLAAGAAGPFGPGGIAAHANGSLHVVYGCFCHRLSAQLKLLASRRLPQPRPYNSFVVLADGTLAMKDIDRARRHPARLMLLDPVTLAPRCPDLHLPESVVPRLSADGDSLYAIGERTVYRYRWDGDRLQCDLEIPYLASRGPSYGWDPVIEGGQLWFLDNGEHDSATTRRGVGVVLVLGHRSRSARADPADLEQGQGGGAPRGAVTDP